MRFQIEGVIRTGNAVLDRGITALVVHVGDDGLHLYASSGRNGGLTGYVINGNGSVTVRSTLEFPPHLTGRVSDHLILDASGGTPRLITGVDGGGFVTYGLRNDMTIGGRLTLTLDQARTAFQTQGNGHTLEALVTMTGEASLLIGPGAYSQQIVALSTVTLDGRQFVLITDTADNAVRSYQRDPTTGRLVETDLLAAKHGLAIQTPTGLELTSVNGVTYAVVISSATSSVSVLQIDANGRLVPTDQVIDTGSTRFAGAQAVATVQSGDHTFVVVGGADHGVTLFLLLPGGTLLYLDTVADTAALSLSNVSALTAVVDGSTIRVFAGSQRDDGVTHLSIPIAGLGEHRTGTEGQATRITGTSGADILVAQSNNDTLLGGLGDDVLVSGPGRTIMNGGAGADIFVVRAVSTRVDVTDFQRGLDRLDLSDLPMLRGVGQLTVTTTSWGAQIVYRGTTIVVTSQDGQPLRVTDIFPQGLVGPDRVPVQPRPELEFPGRVIVCEDRRDILEDMEPALRSAAFLHIQEAGTPFGSGAVFEGGEGRAVCSGDKDTSLGDLIAGAFAGVHWGGPDLQNTAAAGVATVTGPGGWEGLVTEGWATEESPLCAAPYVRELVAGAATATAAVPPSAIAATTPGPPPTHVPLPAGGTAILPGPDAQTSAFMTYATESDLTETALAGFDDAATLLPMIDLC